MHFMYKKSSKYAFSSIFLVFFVYFSPKMPQYPFVAIYRVSNGRLVYN